MQSIAVSPQHVCRIFKKKNWVYIQLNIYIYKSGTYQTYRISMLLYSNLSIKEIGEKCGFKIFNIFAKI